MLVFFDESGDTGFKIGTGSSDLFTVTMVVFEDHDDAQAADDRIALLRREMAKPASFEFHFAKNSDLVRRAFFEAMAPYNFYFFSFVLDKTQLRHLDWPSSEAFYQYLCGLIFESAKPHLDNAIVKLDSCGGREFRMEISTYLKRRINDPQSGRRYIRKVVSSKSNGNNLLQLADMVCGAVARAQGAKKSDADAFYRLIKHREIWVRRWP